MRNAAISRAFCLIFVLMAVLALPAAGLAAQEAAKPKPAPAATFGIESIAPDPSKREVRIKFSQFVPLDVLRREFKLVPGVRIEWGSTSYDNKGVLHLKADYRYDMRYVISLPENLVVEGKRYARNLFSFHMPSLPSEIWFANDKSVIELKSRQLLHVKVQNTQKSELELLSFPLLLTPLALSFEEDPAGFAKAVKQLEQAGAKLASPGQGLSAFGGSVRKDKQVFSLNPERNAEKSFSLPLSFRNKPAQGGAMLINLGSGAPKAYRVTDLALASKSGTSGLLVFATSLSEAKPLAGVNLAGLTKNMEAFALGKTGNDGVLRFAAKELEGLSLKNPADPKSLKRLVKPEEIVFLLAATSDDASYLRLDPKAAFKPRDVLFADAPQAPRALAGQVFTERGIYRPGDTVHFKGAVRQWRDSGVNLPKLANVDFEITGPRGDVVYSSKVKLNDYGSAAADFAIPALLPLGQYTLVMRYDEPDPAPKQAKTAKQAKAKPAAANDEQELSDDADDEPGPSARPERCETSFMVQEFRPPRHFAEIAFKTLDKPLQGFVGREINQKFVSIQAGGSYYVGGPVKHGGLRWKIYAARSSYKVKGFDDYSFGYDGEEKGELLESGETVLDENGKAEILFPLDSSMLSGKSGLFVVASVVDFDGRVSSASKNFSLEPEYKIGVQVAQKNISQGGELSANLLLLDASGNPVPKAEIKVQGLERSGMQTPKRDEKGDIFWDYQDTWRVSFTGQAEIKDGKAVYRTDFASGGEQLVSFSYREPSGRVSSSAVIVHVEGDSSYMDYADRNKPYKTLNLAADRENYDPGQTAKLRVKPRQMVQTYLFTLERDGVLEHKVVTTDQDFANVEFELKADYAPNVYVSALGLTKRGDFPVLAGRYDTEAPQTFFGNLKLPVKLAAPAIKVDIAPGRGELKYLPGQKAEIEFISKNKDGQPVQSELVVAVVMESILAMTGFKTPDFDGLGAFEVPLTVRTEDLRAFLQHQTPFYQAKIEPLTGGDGFEGSDLMNKLRKRFDPVPYYNPQLRTGTDGKASISFTLPDGMTAYRVYALAIDKGAGHGNAERRLTASKDFYLEPGMPEFFSKGDRFKFLVSAFNLGKDSGKFEVKAEAGPGLKLSAPAEAEVSAESSDKFGVSGEATEVGDSFVRLSAKFKEHSDAVENKLRVNSPLVRESVYYSGLLDASGELKLNLPAILGKNPNLEGASAELTLSGSPYLRLGASINYLLTYPYGCVEQTSSGVIGLAAIKDAVKKGLVSGVSLDDVDKYLQKGVNRLLSMRLEGGGFAYWPGRLWPHPWGSAYAALALGLASRQGYPVPPEVLEKTAKYLRENPDCERASPSLKAYAALSLGLAGRLSPKAYAAFGLDAKKQNREGRLVMALARFYSGQVQNAQSRDELLAALNEPANPNDLTYDEFRAQYRIPALALWASQCLMPGSDAASKAAAALLAGVGERGVFSSTADTGFALLALNEYFREAKFPQEALEVSLEQAGEAAQSLKVEPKGAAYANLNVKTLIKDKGFKAVPKQPENLIYRVKLSFPRPDISENGESKGLILAKEIKNSDGSDVIKVGDLVKVTLSLDAGKAGMRYLAVNDPLPAGLVAVNPALKTEEPAPDSDDLDEFQYFSADGRMRLRPDRVEMRDDRVLVFQDRVFSGVQIFEYYARAVCEGDFVMPPSQAEAMYTPGLHAYTKASRLTVEARK